MRSLNTKAVVFVSDFYVEDLLGGAEMTTEALLERAPVDVLCLKALEIDEQLIEEHKDKLWIFGNFTHMKYTLLPLIMHTLKYVVIEYDYKFCLYRSIELHNTTEPSPCECHEYFGKTIALFFANAQHIYWMSEKQRDIYESRFLPLRESQSTVLSSIFSWEDLARLRLLRNKSKKRGGWAVVTHGSWIKGVEDSKRYVEEHHLPVKLFARMDHDRLLEEFAKCVGFVFMPKGGDSCPRMVIEAKLAGCQLAINDHVQHKDEAWFNKSLNDIEAYLESRPAIFWAGINRIIERNSQCESISTKTL